MVKLTQDLITSSDERVSPSSVTVLCLSRKNLHEVSALNICEKLVRLDVSGNRLQNIEIAEEPNSKSLCMESPWKEIEPRILDVLIQLGNENTIFERLMYKNTNQHRRALYFRRLCQVRRDLRLLQSAQLNELVQSSVNLLRQASGECLTGNGFHLNQGNSGLFKIRSLRGRLFGIARFLEQMSEPILIASSQVAGLLGQTFFMPFALTAFSALARFRVLLHQVLHDVVLIFNMLSAQQFEKLASSISIFESHSCDEKEKQGNNPEETPDYIECKWNGVKLCLFSKFFHQHERKTEQDVLQWFAEDRKSRNYDAFGTLQLGQMSSGDGEETNKNGRSPVGKASAYAIQSANLMGNSTGDALPHLDQVVSALDAKSQCGQVTSQRHEGLATKQPIDNTDLCGNGEQVEQELSIVDVMRAKETKDFWKESDVHIESTASISGPKRKVAYISVDIKPAQEKDNEMEESREQNPDSEKQKKDALFDMLTGIGGNTWDTLF